MRSHLVRSSTLGAVLLVTVVIAFLSRGTAATAPEQIGVPFGIEQRLAALQDSVEALQPRKFYLTVDGFDGASATTACAAGYHMASLWEIYNPSGLRYDTARGFNEADSGLGPPADELGWVRTGRAPRIANGPGDANCLAYTSNNEADFGSLAQLEDDWEQEVGPIPPWQAFEERCSFERKVWCVQD